MTCAPAAAEPRTRIGFIGLGAMGSRIAGRLLDAGHPVSGTNRTAGKAQPLIERGLTWLDTLLHLPDRAWFDVELMQKDIRLARRTAADVQIALPSAAVADQMLTEARRLGYGHRDLAALHEVLAETTGPSEGGEPAARDVLGDARSSERVSSRYASAGSGNDATMRVPPVGGLSISRRPPSAVTRSAIPTRP